MKTSSKAFGALVLILSGILASGAAMAQHRGHGGFGHGGGVRFGMSFGVPLFGPAYYPAPYYAYPAPVYSYPAPAYAYPAPAYGYPGAAMGPSAPPAYVEQSTAAPAQGSWYYCGASRSYYPDVSECPGGWQRVPAQP